ncbi:MAG: P-II family nitrogen regulator [Fidelibacterota bacterium]
MKEIKAYIRPSKVDDIIVALENFGIHGMTLINVNALADWADPSKTVFSVKYIEKYCQIVKIELVCLAKDAKDIVDIIRKTGYTGHQGDGKIFISDITDAVSIRTGLHGQQSF